MKLFSAMATVAGMTGLSRIAGFFRDVMMANILGAGPIADAFFVALKLPNFFRKVTAEGAFSVSFVPRYAEVLAKNGQEAAVLFASRAFMMMLLIVSAITLLFMCFMPQIIYAIAPGFESDAARFNMAVEMSRITFPYLLLMSLTALMGGVMNAHDRFAPFAFAPVLFNLSMIIALFFTGFFENAGYALSWGVLVSGFLQLLYLWISMRRAGLHIRIVRPVFSENIKEVFRRIGPGLIGAGVLQINIFVDLILASFLKEGAISYLYYADRLNQLPLGIIGIAVGTALLPMLTKAMAGNDQGEAKRLFNRALEVCLLLGLPAACALLVMPHLLIQLLFEHGAFSAEDTYYTGYVLMGYAVGLPAFIGVKVLSTTFWAGGDTKTPVKVAVISMTSNIILSLILIQLIGVMGITLATGISGWVQYILLRYYQSQELSYDRRLKLVFPKIIICTVLMGGFLSAATWGLSFLLDDGVTFLIRLIFFITLIIAAIAIYGGSIMALKVVNIADFKHYLRRR